MYNVLPQASCLPSDVSPQSWLNGNGLATYATLYVAFTNLNLYSNSILHLYSRLGINFVLYKMNPSWTIGLFLSLRVIVYTALS